MCQGRLVGLESGPRLHERKEPIVTPPISDAHVVITTERLRLAVPQEADVDAIFAIHADPRTYQHRPDLVMKSREEATALLDEWRQHWSRDGIGYFVASTTAGQTIGFCGVRRSVENHEDVLNLYYRFAPQAQGRGYAAEAAQAVIAWAQAEGPQLPIVAVIDPTNTASSRLALKLGLRHDLDGGVLGEHHLYRMPTLPHDDAADSDNG